MKTYTFKNTRNDTIEIAEFFNKYIELYKNNHYNIIITNKIKNEQFIAKDIDYNSFLYALHIDLYYADRCCIHFICPKDKWSLVIFDDEINGYEIKIEKI